MKVEMLPELICQSGGFASFVTCPVTTYKSGMLFKQTGPILSAAVAGMKAIFRPGFNYARTGVMLTNLQADSVCQRELDLEGDEQPDDSKLMTTLNGLNQRFGKGTVLMASAELAGERRAWVMKQERRTPAYTTCWVDLAVLRA